MTINQLLDSIDETDSLKMLAQAYTEISSSRLKKIRQAVEKNRYFLDNLSDIFRLTKHTAYKYNVVPTEKNNKTLSVLITSNYRFYGKVNDDLIRFFIAETAKSASDKIVIGKAGQTFLQAINYNHQYTPITLQKDLPLPQELTHLGSLTQNYSKVFVYFSKMESVLVQKPETKDLTQSPTLTPEEIAASKHQPGLFTLLVHPQTIYKPGQEEDFLFEPDIIKMLNFFETQITTLLLEQAFLESELSRTASRLISMDQAQSNADKMIIELKQLLNLAGKSLDNERVLEISVALQALRKE